MAKDVMSRHALSVDSFATLSDIASVLDKRRIKRVPILEEGKLVGIVSRADLVRAMVNLVPAELPLKKRSDAEIQVELDAVIKNAPSTRTLTLVTTVQDRVVQLLGIARSDDERRALAVLTRNIPGVNRVDDHLQLRSYADA
jgi:signal-transduction protein with cAMP-binding, CBS, and nucleotidyltransferase domain